jgi:transcriptional repressor NrdR
MKCPVCKSSKTKVLDSRPFGKETRRHRKCILCNARFITYEYVDKESINN